MCNRCGKQFARTTGNALSSDLEKVLVIVDSYFTKGADSIVINNTTGSQAVIDQFELLVRTNPSNSNVYLHYARFFIKASLGHLHLCKDRLELVRWYKSTMNDAASYAGETEQTYIKKEKVATLQKISRRFAKIDKPYIELFLTASSYVNKYFGVNTSDIAYGGEIGYKAIVKVFRELHEINPYEHMGKLLHARFILRILKDKTKAVNIDVKAYKEFYYSLMNEAIELAPPTLTEGLGEELSDAVNELGIMNQIIRDDTRLAPASQRNALDRDLASISATVKSEGGLERNNAVITTIQNIKSSQYDESDESTSSQFGRNVTISALFILLFIIVLSILNQVNGSESFIFSSFGVSLAFDSIVLGIVLLVCSVFCRTIVIITMSLSVIITEILMLDSGGIGLFGVASGIIIGIAANFVLAIILSFVSDVTGEDKFTRKVAIIALLVPLLLMAIGLLFPDASEDSNSGNSSNKGYSYNEPIPKNSLYPIGDIVQEDLSYYLPNGNECVRMQYRVWLDTELPVSLQYVEAFSRDLVATQISTYDLNAISVFLYNSPEIYGSYTIASVDWAPYGDWGRADEVRTGDYSKHSYTIRMAY